LLAIILIAYKPYSPRSTRFINGECAIFAGRANIRLSGSFDNLAFNPFIEFCENE
jgi:hypothetical protein